MDLTSQTTIRTSYEVDPDTNILTITLKDGSNVELGTIVIENIKYRSLMRAMEVMASERVPSLETQTGYRVNYAVNTDEGEILFG